jgi:acyl-coenzyme A synthetase/AMP-(fatty) acid ligase
MATAESVHSSSSSHTVRRHFRSPAPETFFDLIECFATTTPDRAALVDVSCARTVSYAELAVSVESLAGKLRSAGIGEGSDVVAIMPRCESLVRLVLAASRVGARCVPYMASLDIMAALATSRIAFTAPVFIFSGGVDAERLSQPGERWLSFGKLEALPAASVNFVPTGANAVYFNETSGSTKSPKLVLATHKELLANTMACVKAFGITASDIHLCTFASHLHEVFARALFTGGSAVIVHESVAEEPLLFLQVLIDHKVTCLMSNATTYAALTSLSRHRQTRFRH